jgi:cytochrome c oxidase subunit II
MFSNASNFVHGVDSAFLIIFGISFFFLISLTTLMIFFVVKYNRNKNVKAIQVKDSTWLEITWTTIPLILVLFMFYVGWAGFLPMRTVPKNAMHVKAIAKMWKWTFEYEGNKQSDTLVLPIRKAVKVDLISTDVLHGFSVPAFRIKEDVVPFKKNYAWFIPGELGDFDLFCTVYCGLSHSYMYAIIRIVPQEDFDKWVAALPVKGALDSNTGYKTLEKNGCLACHSIDGTKVVGPSFKGLYGTSIDVMTNGVKRKVKVDDSYIKSSIYEPNTDIVVDYQQGVMKSYKGIITDKELQSINEYLKGLK